LRKFKAHTVPRHPQRKKNISSTQHHNTKVTVTTKHHTSSPVQHTSVPPQVPNTVLPVQPKFANQPPATAQSVHVNQFPVQPAPSHTVNSSQINTASSSSKGSPVGSQKVRKNQYPAPSQPVQFKPPVPPKTSQQSRQVKKVKHRPSISFSFTIQQERSSHPIQ